MLDNELGWTNYQHRMVNRWQGSQHSNEQDCVAEEVPIVFLVPKLWLGNAYLQALLDV